MRERRLIILVSLAVVVIWLVGALVTRYTLAQMALLAPVAVLVVGATIGIVVLWVRIVAQALRARRD